MTNDQLISLIPLVAVLLSIIGGFFTWALNERSKRRAEEYRRKETRYIDLVSRIRGFTVESGRPELRSEFLDHLNLAWLYCSDEVIQKAYAFLDTVHSDAKGTDPHQQESGERALGEFMLAIRRDLLESKPLHSTSLTSATFRLLGAR